MDDLQETLHFKIRGLHYKGVGPADDKSSLLYMTSEEYGDLLRNNPKAMLYYQDDDGDRVQVRQTQHPIQFIKKPFPLTLPSRSVHL